MNYDQPFEIDNATAISKVRLGDIIPPRDSIPQEFDFSTLVNARSNPYYNFVSKWFYEGIEQDKIPEAKPGIDRKKALRHIHTILGSFEPKHEHKFEAVSYLASLWFEVPGTE